VIYLVEYARWYNSRSHEFEVGIIYNYGGHGSTSGLPPVTTTHAPSIGVAILVVTVGTAPPIVASPWTTIVVTVHDELFLDPWSFTNHK